MKVTKSTSLDSMIAQAKNKIEELDVNASTRGLARKQKVTATECYMDKEGNFGGVPGECYSEEDLKLYWDQNREIDPVLQEYANYRAWRDDSVNSGFLSIVEGGCHEPAKKAEGTETEIDEDLEEVTASVDYDKLDEIAERYNTSVPVSGDWDTEVQHERAAIAEELGVSDEEAKQLMIDYLGFSEEDIEQPVMSSGMLEDVGTWEMVDTKQVPDASGFYTDYTMYRNTITGEYVCVFGDRDMYEPEDGYFDFETENEDEAYEWFDSYDGID